MVITPKSVLAAINIFVDNNVVPSVVRTKSTSKQRSIHVGLKSPINAKFQAVEIVVSMCWITGFHPLLARLKINLYAEA